MGLRAMPRQDYVISKWILDYFTMINRLKASTDVTESSLSIVRHHDPRLADYELPAAESACFDQTD